jgi:hypothetical protein
MDLVRIVEGDNREPGYDILIKDDNHGTCHDNQRWQ